VLVVRGVRQLATTLRDARGNLVTGRAVGWVSSTPAVATVSATGIVTGSPRLGNDHGDERGI